MRCARPSGYWTRRAARRCDTGSQIMRATPTAWPWPCSSVREQVPPGASWSLSFRVEGVVGGRRTWSVTVGGLPASLPAVATCGPFRLSVCLTTAAWPMTHLRYSRLSSSRSRSLRNCATLSHLAQASTPTSFASTCSPLTFLPTALALLPGARASREC